MKELQSKDLRIGNLVETPDGLKEVTEINEECFYVAEFKNTWAEIKPIPLTEEWLLKMGFEKIGTNYEKDWLLLHGNIKTGTIDFLLNEPKTGKYKATILNYLHQLQNLVHSLTGEELTINN